MSPFAVLEPVVSTDIDIYTGHCNSSVPKLLCTATIQNQSKIRAHRWFCGPPAPRRTRFVASLRFDSAMMLTSSPHLAAVHTGFSIAATVEAFVQPDLLHFQDFSWMISTALGMVIAADGILTVLLTIVLHRSRTGFKSTDSMINVLIMYTINTVSSIESKDWVAHILGVVSTISTISFFMAVFYPHTLIDDGLNLFVAKLYANSLLAVLNSRHFLSSCGKTDYEATPSKISAIHRSDLVSNASDRPSGRDPLANSQHVLDIRVTVETQRDASFSGDTLYADRKLKADPSPAIALRDLRGSAKAGDGDDASQDAVSHNGPSSGQTLYTVFERTLVE
uniref:Neutral alpha-glucosidase AB n=1 Tax=Ganoderma boninense TaxID=34458 RepID=A0A5K1K608_9APHY|nr:Neutral alpha-glucosidase AB [Ganoderma boninense]